MKKKIKYIYLGVALICIICVAAAGVMVYSSLDELGLSDFLKEETPVVDEDVVILYRKPKNPTEIQTVYYDELIESTKKYPEEYDPFTVAGNVVKTFIADFYTWTNKEGNFDVGGLDQILGQNHINFMMYVRDTFYQNFNFFEKEYGVENLMEVESVTIRKVDYASNIVIDGNECSTYYVEAEWTYKEGSSMDTSKLQNKGYYLVVKNYLNGRFEIAEMYRLD